MAAFHVFLRRSAAGSIDFSNLAKEVRGGKRGEEQRRAARGGLRSYVIHRDSPRQISIAILRKCKYIQAARKPVKPATISTGNSGAATIELGSSGIIHCEPHAGLILLVMQVVFPNHQVTE